MKGILLAGGHGTRLFPLTRVVSKHLLPVYDKPMFYYPLCSLMEAGAREVLLIAAPSDLPLFQKLLGSGRTLGLRIFYRAQERALGIADALRIGRDFIGNDRVALALGDNVFAGDCTAVFRHAAAQKDAVVFTSPVPDPVRYGIATVQGERVTALEEKPARPASNLAVVGMYFYPPDCAAYAAKLSPSARGELEITDLNRRYLQEERLCALPLPCRWQDAGTSEGLLRAAALVREEELKGRQLGCLEERAYRLGLIDRAQFERLWPLSAGSDYGAKLRSVPV